MALIPYFLPKSVLFQMDPEVAHDLTIGALARFQNTPLACLWAESRVQDPVTLAGVTFPNRVGMAAGLDKNGRVIDYVTIVAAGDSRFKVGDHVEREVVEDEQGPSFPQGVDDHIPRSSSGFILNTERSCDGGRHRDTGDDGLHMDGLKVCDLALRGRAHHAVPFAGGEQHHQHRHHCKGHGPGQDRERDRDRGER